MATVHHTQTERKAPSAATVAKAAQLEVVTMTRHLAFVQGDSDVYQVWLPELRCSCKAGTFGVTCAHKLAVQAELHTEVAARRNKPRAYAMYDATTRDLAVMCDGRVIDHCRTWLEAEELIADLTRGVA